MANRKRKTQRKTFKYFYLNKKLHKVIRISRVKDSIVAWSYLDHKRVMYSYSDVIKNMQNAYTMTEVGKILNKHKVTIEDYILEQKILPPQKAYPIGKKDSKWSKYLFSEDDILDLHEFILSAGRNIESLPNRNELKALLKHNIILYTRTNDGKFVPVWKAD